MKKLVIAGLTGIVSFLSGFVLGGKVLVKMINDYKRWMDRNQVNMMVFNGWLEFIYSGGNIQQYFYEHGYKKILVYGNGYIGKRLVQALSNTNIEVVAVMDKAADSNIEGILIGTDSKIPNIDCAVITPVFYYEEIYDLLRKKLKTPIISIDMLWNHAAEIY